jgi:Calcineurin-like phosphoesterase
MFWKLPIRDYFSNTELKGAIVRIRILSDLHQEFGQTEIPKLDVDLIILAGDISTKQNALPWVRDFCGDTPTAYVCGNHEFYGDKLPRVRERLSEMTADSNIHVLEDSYFTVGSWNVYGCSLWTDMALMGDWKDGVEVASKAMNDYRSIRNSNRNYKRLTPTDTRLIHLNSLQRMERFFESHDPSRTIIVTHHAPSALSLASHRQNDPVSCAYASHLDDFILRHQPPLWVHGHIHRSNDYHIGKTRIISNPQAYPMDLNEDFDAQFVLELPD